MNKDEFWRAYDDAPLLVRLPVMFLAYVAVCFASIPVMFMLLFKPFSARSANVRRR